MKRYAVSTIWKKQTVVYDTTTIDVANRLSIINARNEHEAFGKTYDNAKSDTDLNGYELAGKLILEV